MNANGPDGDETVDAGDRRDHEAELQAILDTAIDGIITIDERGVIESFNTAAKRLFGYEAREVVGQNVSMLMPPPWREQHDGYLRRYLETCEPRVIGIGREVEGLCKDGSTFPCELAVTEVTTPGRRLFTGFIRDLTSARRTQRDRLRALRRLEAQFAVTRALAVAPTMQQAVPALLEALCETLGWEVGELWCLRTDRRRLERDGVYTAPGLSASGFGADRGGQTFATGMGLPGRVWETGRAVWLEDITRAPDVSCADPAIRAGLRGALGFPVQTRTETGGVVVLFSGEARPAEDETLTLVDALGTQIGAFLERRRLEAEFRQAQKLEAVGRLAAGIAHDFKNLLMGVMGCAGLASTQLDEQSEARYYVREIATATERGIDLTRQLLAFSRRQPDEPLPVCVDDAIGASEGLVRQLVGEDVDLQIERDAPGAYVMADPGHVDQIVMNLVTNARDAMPSGGRLRVRTSLRLLDDACEDSWQWLPPGRYVQIEVSDSGCGMDPETRARAFEPFYTTKPTGEGSGLGLSTVYGIVRQLGGLAELETRLGEGTTVRILLPASDERQAGAGAGVSDEATPPRGDGETVLVVEDEGLVRMTAVHLLEDLGYRAVEAASGEEALRLADAHEGRIHVLLTDMVLPGMSGRELAQALRSRRSDVHPVFMSAYPPELLVQQRRLTPGCLALEKPFDERELAVTLRTALRRAPSPECYEGEQAE
jgi:PAS domain S-box-containing protein